jgi:UDP-N-acetylglucosamine/UDP-N-acetylgalactosamine diphosphorylase
MELKLRSDGKIRQLLQQGVDIPNPLTIDIGDEVRLDQISPKGVRIYPGCRIYGEKTAISKGCRIGQEAPVTIENCRLGAGVELKGGFFSQSVFLEKANMGMGAHVREGCILEEEANGAHCVGLKQTILFPFVTLGSLINFCDCFMAGGTSRQNHSEVGSSYIHFNFTPDADKTTPSLIGDVPRGVMLNQPPIFLGGQGGIVGPVRLGYGNVVAAGSILRQDYPADHQLIFAPAPPGSVRAYVPAAYPQIRRILENNILYMANLAALGQWYTYIRKPFLEAQEFGPLLYEGLMEQLALAGKERIKRLKTMAEKAADRSLTGRKAETVAAGQAFSEHMKTTERLFSTDGSGEETRRRRDVFLDAFWKSAGNERGNYIEAIRHLPADVSSAGVQWLSGQVEDLCRNVAGTVPSLELFR